MVNVGRLWREGRFQTLQPETKLLYIYLATSPNINTLGLLNVLPDSVWFDLGITERQFRIACKELLPRYIEIFNCDGEVYFLVKDHFATLPRSAAVSKRADKDIKMLPESVVEYMTKNKLMPDIQKHTSFAPPTDEEIEEYALSKGHLLEGKIVREYYEGKAEVFGKKGWYDSRGREVRDWRAKLRNVWFKDENKLQESKGAPKGYEYFFVKEGSRNVVPVRWQDGLPFSGNGIADDILLQREFKKQVMKK